MKLKLTIPIPFTLAPEGGPPEAMTAEYTIEAKDMASARAVVVNGIGFLFSGAAGEQDATVTWRPEIKKTAETPQGIPAVSCRTPAEGPGLKTLS